MFDFKDNPKLARLAMLGIASQMDEVKRERFDYFCRMFREFTEEDTNMAVLAFSAVAVELHIDGKLEDLDFDL